ncbi:putative ribonuclease H-like domain-containing protein, partial [Tanacetum coccineum]
MDKCKTRLGYNAVPPPYTGNFMPPKPDLVYPSLDDFVDVNESVSESVVEKPTVETNEPKTARKENGAPIIENWVSESEEQDEPKFKTFKPNFTKIEFVKPKTNRKPVEQIRQATYSPSFSPSRSPRGNKRNWNQQMSQKLGSDFEIFNKACHVCGSFDHLKNDCNNWYNNGRFAKSVWTNVQRVNKQNLSKLTHLSPNRNMVPRTVLSRSGPILANTVRPVNIVQPRTSVDNARPMKNVINNAYSTPRRSFNKITIANNSNFTKKVNTVKGTRVNTARTKAVLSAVKGNKGNAVKASACWVWRPKHKILDHVSRNNGASMSFKRFDYIDAQGRSNSETDPILQIMKKLMEDLLPLEVIPKEGKLLGKKNSVLFTDSECVVLSPNIKLTDESHVLLKVHRKDNMYSVDLKNVVPQGGLTCLFAKAILDESNLWDMRLGHLNFKIMNKMKGKQHRASCKTKTISSISQSIQMLHMDLFGPTFVKSLMKKMYCLVVTDDFSRCDNGTEIKNRVMNQFCEMKGIKREFSVARTSQQNKVAKRKNRTIIEAARTMLADSKSPTTFWAEAVNTACYVQNRVLVIKPHNKTPYELFLGRKPSLSFMRPFRCPVTILNTIDHLGKFDGKADEGFFVGYSTNSKSFRVFNSRTRIVEENLHVQFRKQSNGNACTKACDDVGKARLETIPGKDYILLPLWTQDPPFSSSPKNSPDAGFKPSGEEEKKDAEDPGNESGNPPEGKDSEVPSTEEPRINQEKDASVNNTNNINTISPTVNATSIEDNDVDENIVYACADDPNIPDLEEIFQIYKRAIGTKWVYRNNKDERGIVIRNKARIEAIRLFLAYASFKDFVVYQMDVKSAFLYGKIEEEVYVCQPPRFEDPDFPDKVYKVEKALYGLHQAPKA